MNSRNEAGLKSSESYGAWNSSEAQNHIGLGPLWELKTSELGTFHGLGTLMNFHRITR